MRKSTLFISVVLTTFMLAVLFGVASAYKGIVSTSTESAPVAQQPSTTVDIANQVVPATQVVPVQPSVLAPETAAAIAGKVLGRTDMYSIEMTQYEGVDAYLVTFSSGDLVYLSLDGQVLSISKLPVTVITQRTSGGGGGGGGGGGNNSSNDDHDDDDHEDEDDD